MTIVCTLSTYFSYVVLVTALLMKQKNMKEYRDSINLQNKEMDKFEMYWSFSNKIISKGYKIRM